MTNPGPSPVTVLGVTVVDDAAGVFALAVTTPFTVGPGETTIIEFVITAPDVGTFTARLVFDVGDPAIAIGATLTVRGSWWRVVDGVATAASPAGTSWDGTVRSTATGIQLVRVVQGKEVVDAAPTAGVRAVHVGGTDGDDRLVLDLLTPLVIPLSVDGGAGADTLVGPNSDTTWAVTVRDKGSVSGVTFASIENLAGAANNHDNFEFAAGRRPQWNGRRRRRRVRHRPPDGRPLHARRVRRARTGFGRRSPATRLLITYAGMEPIVDDLNVADRVFTGTIIADRARLKRDATTGKLVIESDNDLHTFESVTFDDPTGSLTILLGIQPRRFGRAPQHRRPRDLPRKPDRRRLRRPAAGS